MRVRPSNKREGQNDQNGNADKIETANKKGQTQTNKVMKDTANNKTADNNKSDNNTADNKRTKANYPVVMGTLLGHIEKNPGVTRNDLNKQFGTQKENDGKLKFSVIYEALKRLIAQKKIFGNGAKKNETFWMTQKEATEHKPEPRATTPRKADQPFVLETLGKNGKWRATMGGSELKPIQEAYDLSIKTDGTFRIRKSEDNSIVKTNEEPKASKPAATTDKVPAKK
jgi:hypothetical protein